MAAVLFGAIGTGVVLWSTSCFAQADDTEPARLRLSGFGTLGVVHADAPEGWSYRRDIGQAGSSRSTRIDVDSRIGLQLNYVASPQVELVGQLLAARLAPYANRSDTVEWAFAAYRPDPEWTLRVGRVNLDQFLISNYRDVGFAYPYVRPPVDFYGLIPSRVDGADLTRSWDLGGAKWRAKGFLGRNHTGDLSTDSNTLVKATYGLMVSREADGLLLRVGLARAKFGDLPSSSQSLYEALSALMTVPVASVANEAAQLRQRFDFANTSATYAALAVSYEWNQWQLTGEAARVSGHPVFSFNAGYISVARRVGSVTGFGSFSRVRGSASRITTPDWATSLAPVLGSAGANQAQFLASAATDGINSSVPSQRTLSLGARWDVHPQLALKLQFDRIFVDEFGGRFWVNSTTRSASPSVTSVTADFIF